MARQCPGPSGASARIGSGDAGGPRGSLVLAWRGREEESRAEATTVGKQSSARRQAGVVVHAEHGLGVLELSKGNCRAALEHAGRVDAEDSYFLPAPWPGRAPAQDGRRLAAGGRGAP
jgi:hypothetical protein